MSKVKKEVTLGSIDDRFDRLEGFLESSFQAIGQQFQVIDGRLDGMDGRLDVIDGRLDGMDGSLIRIEHRLEEHDKLLAELKEGQNKIFNILDSIMKKQEIDDDERLVLQHQLDKMILWARQVADKIGVELTA